MNTPKYLFFTYGVPGWRGVQIRGIRVAQYFNKNEVIFWNGGDDKIIKNAGYKVKNIDLSLITPSQIKLPKTIETVIFADIPTNEFFQFSLFSQAKKEGKKIVLFDQIYRRGQIKEFVYKKLAEESSVFFLNGLSFFKKEESENFKIIPPLIEVEIPKNPKVYLAKKYQLPADKSWIFGIGYHDEIKKKFLQLAEKLNYLKVNFHLIYTSEIGEKALPLSTFATSLPFNLGDDFFLFIRASEISLIKFGFLQLIETIALNSHPIVLGEAGYLLQNKNVVDKKIWEAIYFTEEIDKKLLNHIYQFLTDEEYKKNYLIKLKKLHDGSIHGGKIAAEIIKNLKKRQKKLSELKQIVVIINDEILKYQNFLRKNEGKIFPVVFICSIPQNIYIIKRPDEKLLSSPIESLITPSPSEILPHSFKEVYVLARRKYDSFLEIMPWYEDWVNHLDGLFKKSNKIFISKKGVSMLENMLRKYNNKIIELK